MSCIINVWSNVVKVMQLIVHYNSAWQHAILDIKDWMVGWFSKSWVFEIPKFGFLEKLTKVARL